MGKDLEKGLIGIGGLGFLLNKFINNSSNSKLLAVPDKVIVADEIQIKNTFVFLYSLTNLLVDGNIKGKLIITINNKGKNKGYTKLNGIQGKNKLLNKYKVRDNKTPYQIILGSNKKPLEWVKNGDNLWSGDGFRSIIFDKAGEYRINVKFYEKNNKKLIGSYRRIIKIRTPESISFKFNDPINMKKYLLNTETPTKGIWSWDFKEKTISVQTPNGVRTDGAKPKTGEMHF